MGILEYLIAALASAPAMLLWIAVIIYGAVKMNRGGGRAEGFLVAGGSIKLVVNILGIANIFFGTWLFHRGYDIASISNIVSLCRSIVSMAGTLCLLYAFWVKFKSRKEVEIIPDAGS
jgi:hypothetical protein